MKWLFILTLAILCLGNAREIHAEIRNGHTPYLVKAERRIRNLNELAQGTLSKYQHRRLNKLLKEAHISVEKLKENHVKTQKLLADLRMIDPDLYKEISTLKDREGNNTNVYVRVVDDLGPVFLGVNNVTQSAASPHIYTSEYGDHTVSVMLVYPNALKALKILVHELGHVRYQVPHLATYVAYYRRAYLSPYYQSQEIGHKSSDPSHQPVIKTMTSFKKIYKQYYREKKQMAQVPPPKVLASGQVN